MAFKKGDRVKWVGDDNQEHYGTVVKGGREGVTAVEDGGNRQATGTIDGFEKSDKPLPTHKPSVMDKYSVEKFKTIPGGQETQIFSAVIWAGGIPIASVTNDGRGGCNSYMPLTGETQKTIDRAQIHAADWAKEHGIDNPIDSLDLWMDWFVNGRPYGQTADEFFRPLREALAKA